jgi:phage terminase Nu1 subunit (DNA packaging protein)
MLPQSKPADDRLLVNKSQLATILKCSLPTLAKLLEDYPDLPVVTRGGLGAEWVFDAGEVTRYLEERRAAERRAAEQQTELFKQFSLPIDDAPEMQAGQGLTPKQRRDIAGARLIERKLAQETGQLVTKSELRMALNTMIGGLGRFLDTLPGQIGRRHGLPDEVVASMRARIDDQRRLFVEEMQKLLRADAADVGG